MKGSAVRIRASAPKKRLADAGLFHFSGGGIEARCPERPQTNLKRTSRGGRVHPRQRGGIWVQQLGPNRVGPNTTACCCQQPQLLVTWSPWSRTPIFRP